MQDRTDFNLLGQMDSKKHRNSRQLVKPVYSLKSVRESEEYMHEPLSVFGTEMHKRANQEIDIVDWLSALTLGGSFA